MTIYPSIIELVSRSRGLLQESIRKHDSLIHTQTWSEQLIPRSVPVLWFGDALDDRPRILTVAANPSRSEFLDGRRGDLLTGNKARLYTRNAPSEEGNDIDFRSVLESYNSYFRRNPYANWFGKKAGGKVEAFLNGMGASMYPGDSEMVGIHIDLLPFATRDDFKAIRGQIERDFFSDGWAQVMFLRIIGLFNPRKVVITGSGNTQFAEEQMRGNLQLDKPKQVSVGSGRQIKARFGKILGAETPVISISVNLGNPVGWKREDLVELGARVK